MNKNLLIYQRTLVLVGLAAAAVALVLLLTSLLAGGSQETFQIVRPVEEYTALLKSQAFGLRLSFTFDDIFIVLYTAFFTLLVMILKGQADHSLVNLALGAILLTAVLDAVENAHILTMLAQAEAGLPIPLSEIAWQMMVSQIKFLSSYLSIFLIGLIFPRETLLEKMTAWSFLFLQLPLGVLILTLPREWAAPLVIARAAFFIVGLLLTAKIYWDRSQHG